jgi:anaerobic selenocysteine-containing dehydrogenase
VQAAPLVPLDAYSLRLVSGRKLYDLGSTVQASSSLAPLAPGAVLGLNPYDFDRLGVAPGTRVRLSSSRTAVVAEARPDPGGPRGSASLPFNQPGVIAADLIDVTSPVTDVRVETIVRSEA